MGKGKGPAEENGKLQAIFLGVTFLIALLGLILAHALIVFEMDVSLPSSASDDALPST